MRRSRKMEISPTLRLRSSALAHFVELRESFASDIQAISPFVDRLMLFISKFRNGDSSELDDIEMALREALANAVVHGNREDPRKHVFVTCRCRTNGEVSIRVQDEGQGFDGDTVPDPTALENRLHTTGRGIYLMKTLMDEFHSEQRGAVVHMRKRANARSAAERKTGS
jgi:serine/threonine-protein kinase RsbW